MSSKQPPKSFTERVPQQSRNSSELGKPVETLEQGGAVAEIFRTSDDRGTDYMARFSCRFKGEDGQMVNSDLFTITDAVMLQQIAEKAKDRMIELTCKKASPSR